MKKNFLILFFLISVSFFIPNSFAWKVKKSEFRWKNTYRFDDRHSAHRIYISRINADFNILDNQGGNILKFGPYLEGWRNIVRDKWEQERLGLEIGKDVLPWFYLGFRLQQLWAKDDHQQYGYVERRNHRQMEGLFKLSHNLVSLAKFKLDGFIQDEYTYDINKARGIRNEVSIGLVVPIGKQIETSVNWRHIDRVHFYDSDTFEASVSLIF